MHELPWLPTTPVDFNERCSHLKEHIDLAKELISLAAPALSINQSNRLYRSITKLESHQREALKNKFSTFKLGLVSNATMNLCIPALVTSALRLNILLEVETTDFGQIAQEAFDPDSTLNQAGLDAILLALDYRAYPFAANAIAMTSSELQSRDALNHLEQIRQAFNANSGALCIVQTLACPPFNLLGNLDTQLHGMLQREINEFNTSIADEIGDSNDVLLDVATIANTVGTYNWYDERQWHLAKVPMANRFIPLYSHHVARVVAAIRGKSKKCLVLDLDNTLWGGVVGDDGIDGINIGAGNPIGEAYLAIQQHAFELKKMGIILAVCSKNEEEIARQAFKEHPDMVLKESDFSVFIANWEDKASNIRNIAKTLNIGLDSIVFIDDNPAEREIVRTLVPEVTVPELPQDPSLIPRTIAAAGYFEAISFTKDDAERGKQYAQNTMREKTLKESAGLDDYLKSLEMIMTLTPFNEIGRKRIVQLINKTNQFNLTTNRYTETEVIEFETSPSNCTLQARLVDKFGDNGMISVVICKTVNKIWEIDSWLMSCRVIKRRAEEAICDELVKLAQENGVELIRGFYHPTTKNNLVKEHYHNLGFKKIDSTPEKDTWELEIKKYTPKNPPIKIIH